MHTRQMAIEHGGVFPGNAAPIVTSIRVAGPKGTQHPREWNGLIDTGSPCTVFPQEIATDLRMQVSTFRDLRSFGQLEPARPYPEYDIRLSIPGLLDGIRLPAYAARGRHYILLGRDFINQHVLLIDGPAQAWTIAKPSTFLRMALWCLGVRR